MSSQTEFDAWSAGRSYELYMGRWSRRVASEFLAWLDPPEGKDWIEAGCGTGALTASILQACSPASILSTDASAEFVGHARETFADPRVSFRTAQAHNLPVEDQSVDVVTSALVMNFLPDPVASLVEMQRVLRPGGLLTFYVWDYPGGGVGFIDAFWKAAIALDQKAAEFDEGARFPLCTEEGLIELCAQAGIGDPEIAPIEIVTVFPDFEAFWHPFTLGAGPAPGYCVSLPEDQRQALKSHLLETLGQENPIRLMAKAWAVKVQIAG